MEKTTNKSTGLENAMIVEKPKKIFSIRTVIKVLILSLVIYILLGLRYYPHDVAVWLWKYKTFIAIGALCIIGFWKWRKMKRFPKLIRIPLRIVLMLTTVLMLCLFLIPKAYYHTYRWYVCAVMDKEEIHEMPYTENERLHDKETVDAYAHSKTNGNLPVTTPRLITNNFIDSSHIAWSMSRSPIKKNFWQFDDDITKAYIIPAHTAMPNIVKHSYDVNFTVGEAMHWDKNAFVNAVKRLRHRYFNYETDKVVVLEKSKGEYVLEVTLIKWTGWLFPIPVIGGVIEIPSREVSTGGMFIRTIIGQGTFIPASDFHKYPYLDGQNLFSEEYARFYAEVFSYRNGINEAIGNKKSAVEIPDVENSSNHYPFFSYYNWSKTKIKTPNGLYMFIPLEPSDSINSSMAISFFMKADGLGKIYYYDHASVQDGTSGVSIVGGTVKKVYPQYAWGGGHFRIADVRLYLPNIPELTDTSHKTIPNYFFITSVVAINEKTNMVDASAIPDIVAINMSDNNFPPVKLDGYHPENWINQMRVAYKLESLTPQKVDTIRNKVVVITDTIRNSIPAIQQPDAPVVPVTVKTDTVKKETPVLKQPAVVKDTVKPVVKQQPQKPKPKKKKG
jgi:hypothetical protein